MPAEFHYFPFDDGPGEESMEDRWEAMMQFMRTTGVLIPWDQTSLNPSTGDLAITANGGLSVQSAVGEAWIHGFMFQQQDDYYSITISPNTSGNPRIDLVTARLDTDANTIVIHVEEGTPDPSPVAPTPIESDPIWDLSLAEVYVADGAVTILSGNITDTRVISKQGDGGSSAVTLTSGTGDESLVSDGVGPDLEIKAITAGPNISLTSDGEQVTIEATGAGSDVTLASAGGTQTLVATGGGVGPSLQSKGLSSSTGISLSSDASSVTITNSDPASGVTLTNAGSGSTLVNDGSGPSLGVKSLTASKNINFTVSSTDIAIAYNTPYCRVTETSPGSWTNGTNQNLTYTTNLNDPTNMHSTVMNTDRINIATTGLYACNLNVQITFSGTTTGPVYFYIINSTTVLASTGENWRVTSEDILINLSCIVPLSAGDYVVTRMNNTSGLTVTPVYSVSYTPVFSVCYVGSL